MRAKNKIYEGISQSLKSFGNLDSQMALDERPLTPNGTTRGQVDPAQVWGWNLATNDVPILENVRGNDQARVFSSMELILLGSSLGNTYAKLYPRDRA